MKIRTILLVIMALVFFGCSDGTGPNTDGGTDAGTDGGPGTDTPADGTDLECSITEINCHGVCTDVSSDPNNCGACDNVCDPDIECISGLCDGGGLTCPQGTIDCFGECIDVSADPEACGACNAGECSAREYCYQGLCECRPGLSDCQGTCVDLDSDPANCGACGTPCGEVCGGGACGAACDLDTCDGACVDLETHPLHCGNCNNACFVDQVCFAGGCWDYQPALGCTSCSGFCKCPIVEPCCDLPGYGPSCVDSPQPCPY